MRPSSLGAAYLLALTAWASRAPIVDETDHALGHQARQVGDLVEAHFSGDVRHITIAIVAAALGVGAALGALSSLLVRARARLAGRPAPEGPRLAVRSLALLVPLHAWLVMWGMARAPQAYAPSFYARGGVRRLAQIVATDTLGVRGCVLVGLVAVALYVLGPPSRWRAHLARLSYFYALIPKRSAFGLLLLAAGISALLRVPAAHADAPRHDHPNIIILAADSLRADRLTPQIAPHLSALAARGSRFDRAYVSLPRTFPSWVTILTGRHAHHHGVRSMFARYEDRARDLDALPAHFAKAGYRTGVVSDYAGDIFGRVDLGFGTVDTPTFNFHELIRQRAIERQLPLLPLLDSRAGRALFPVIREWNEAADADLLAGDAIDAVDRMQDAPFLLTVFFSTAHFPYAAPAPYYARFTDPNYRGRYKYHKPVGLGSDDTPDEADVRQIRGLYDGAVASIDDAAARIARHLEKRGLAGNTIVVITADHGETLFDNGHGQGHGDHLFGDEGTHVPLVVFDPRRPEPLRHGAIARDVDIAPTLYDLAGVPAPRDLDGRSLAPAMAGGRVAPAFAYAETELWMGDVPALPDAMRLPYPTLSRISEVDVAHGYEVVLRKEYENVTTVARHRMIRDERYKLIYIPARRGVTYQLYDTQVDPAEIYDIADDHPDVTARLKGELWRWMLTDGAMVERSGFLQPRSIEVQRGASEGVLRIGDSADLAPGGATP